MAANQQPSITSYFSTSESTSSHGSVCCEESVDSFGDSMSLSKSISEEEVTAIIHEELPSRSKLKAKHTSSAITWHQKHRVSGFDNA